MKTIENKKVPTEKMPLASYPKSNKKEIAAQLRKEGFTDVRYSGKDRCFYAAK